MNDTPPEIPAPATLEQLLLRDDMWMGHSQRFITRSAVTTGYEQLNLGLLNQGWPLGNLIEVCQQGMQGEWQLFTPALLQMPGLLVLLNPPATPFSQAFIQAGIDLERLVVVAASEKSHFIACFIELTRASTGALLAWQPNDALTYTELRKCSLAASEGTGLSVMFRPPTAQRQSSPAALRLFAQIIPMGLEITVFKQKGHLLTQQPRPVVLALPAAWNATRPYPVLNQKPAAITHDTESRRPARVTPLRGKP